MLIFEVADLRFLLCQDIPGPFQLACQKLGPVFGLPLPHLQIFINEQIRQFACYFLSDLRISRRIVNIESSEFVPVANKLDLNVLTHELDLLVGCKRPVRSSIKIQLIDDLQEPSTTEDLLRNALQTLLQIVAYVGHDVVFWHG